jgi:hypothetical protein
MRNKAWKKKQMRLLQTINEKKQKRAIKNLPMQRQKVKYE